MLMTISDLGKSFGAERIFEKINAKIEDRDRIALIGPNGAGKTTLLNLIAGLDEPDEGSISRADTLRIGYLRQNGGLLPDGTIESEMRRALGEVFEIEQQMLKTGERMAALTDHGSGEYHRLEREYQSLEERYLSLDGYGAQVKINTVLSGMGFGGFERSTPVERMSGGERTRLMLAKLLVEQPELLILDEATNHLDFRMLGWLEEYLLGYKGAILTVSHDRYFLDRVTTATWEIENLSLITYPAPYGRYLTLREERLERMEKEYERYTQEVARLQDYHDRNIVRATTSSSAKSRLRMIEHLGEAEKPFVPMKPPKFSFTPKLRPVSDILIAENLTLEVGEGERHKTLLSDFSLHVKRGERLAIIGENGAGKSTLLKTLTGRLPHRRGSVEWGRNVRLSVFEQDSSDLHPDKTALMELWDRFPSSTEHELRTLLGGLQLVGEEAFKKIGVLSGGERARIKLAFLMMEHANVLVMDEPTNHLDIPAKESLEQALLRYEGTLIIVSHDRYLLSRLPTRILRMADGCAESFEGNFEEMQRQLALREEREREQKQIPMPKAAGEESAAAKDYYRSKAQRRAEAEQKRRTAELEAEIARLEAAVQEAQDQLAAPEAVSDFERLTELTEQISGYEQALEAAYQEWDRLLSR